MAELIGDTVVETPEHDKQREIAERDAIRTLVDFGEWLSGEGVHLMRYEPVEVDRGCDACMGAGWQWPGQKNAGDEPHPYYPSGTRMMCRPCNGTGSVLVEREQWIGAGRFRDLAFRFLGIDESKLEDERRAILEAVRNA